MNGIFKRKVVRDWLLITGRGGGATKGEGGMLSVTPTKGGGAKKSFSHAKGGAHKVLG